MTKQHAAPPLHPMDRVRGPRVIVKRDAESSIGRGAVLFGAHFQPKISAIVMNVCNIVRDMDCGDSVWITEGYRDIRDTRDLHEELLALDLTISNKGVKITPALYDEVADRLAMRLGPDYDVVAHGEGPQLHIHAEWDPEIQVQLEVSND